MATIAPPATACLWRNTRAWIELRQHSCASPLCGHSISGFPGATKVTRACAPVWLARSVVCSGASPLYRKRIVNPRGPSDQSCHQVVRGRGKVEEEGRLTKRRALASRCFWRICRELIAGHGVQVIEAIKKGLTPVVYMSTVEWRTREGLYMKLNRAVARTDVLRRRAPVVV